MVAAIPRSAVRSRRVDGGDEGGVQPRAMRAERVSGPGVRALAGERHTLLRTCVLPLPYFGVHVTCALAQGECPPQPA